MSSGFQIVQGAARPMYGLSAVFTIVDQLPPITLVSNTGQTRANESGAVQSQPFTTGSNLGGYTLTSVDVGFQGDNVRTRLFHIVPTMGNGEPDLSDPTKFITLTTPGSTTANRIHTFAAPADANLAANTTYHLYLANSDGGVPGNIHRTSSNAEDDGGAPGWSIGNKRYWRNGNSGPWTDDTTNIVRMQINGLNALPSTDATLSGLAIEGATGGESITLSPAFDVNTLTYTASVGNRIDEVTLTATTNHSNATVAITGDDDTNTKNEANLDLDVGSNTLTVTVTAEDANTTETYTITVTRAHARPDPTLVPATWGLKPRGLDIGDQFRLIFLSSTKRNASSTSIGDYNTWVQTRAAAGHADIQAYSHGFTVVGCTAAKDARDNTDTRHNSADRGVPIYWLGGNKVADEYQDFYDKTWDNEANPKNELGNDGLNISQVANQPWTGCDHNGTEAFPGDGFVSAALGQGFVTPGVPNSTSSTYGPLSSNTTADSSNNRPMYGLSEVFEVVQPDPTDPVKVPETWNLIPAGLGTGDQFRLLFGTSGKRDATATAIGTYNTFVQNAAAAGHSDIQSYSSAFWVVGSTAGTDARDNTGTTYTSADKGVPIYWLGGNKVADDYEDFYDESWDDEANTKDESGSAVDLISFDNGPYTGSSHDGIEFIFGGSSLALGSTSAVVGAPNSPDTSRGPIYADFTTSTQERAFYGLSAVFIVGTPTAPDAPTFLSATPSGTSQIQLSWHTPASNDGSPIAGYKIEYSLDGDSNWTTLVADTGTAETEYSDAGLSHGTTRYYRVSAINSIGTGPTSNVDGATVGAPPNLNTVPETWSLIPTGLGAGDQFRLIFGTSGKRDATATAIGTYNTFVQDAAAVGHSDIQPYSSGFRVVGSTAGTDARDNTGTTYTSADKGVPIYWLSGTKVADDYQDFYDESWDDEANTKDESGSSVDLISFDNGPYTGSSHDGIEFIFSGSSLALGSTSAVVGAPNSPDTTRGPIYADFTTSTQERPFYGLSAVFIVGNPNAPSPPRGLTANADGSSQIDLEWTAPAQDGGEAISGYKIQSSPNGISNWTNLVSNTGNAAVTYSDTGLSPENTRHYRVFAINSIGTGPASNVANATTTVSPLGRVTGVNITPSDGALSVTWATVSDATGYKVQWKSDGQSYNTSDRQALISSRSTTNYLISGLNNGTLYTVRVIAATKAGANDGPPSVEMTGTPSPIPPSVTFGPGSFTASENGATARVTVEISVPADVTIPFRVQHRNGATSADYSGVPRRLIFEDGNTIRSFTVTAVDDSDNDDGEKIRIEFKDLPAGFQAGARSAITVKLKDNDGGNSLPLFDPANELRNLVENTAANQNVGLPITATDADGDSLSYTFDGPDMDRFTFVPSTAQIRTRSGQTYDYETHELFVVRVTADDGNGGSKTATVVIRVRNVAEPPQEPTGLTLVQAYPTSMALSWTPPDNTGRPAITGYDLQYKKSNETTWTAGLQGITETSDSITGLDPSTSYHVQVRANNDEGNGTWSSTLSRSTPSLSPGVSITKTNLTVTEGNQTGVTYLIVLGSEPTDDVFVYISGYEDSTVAPHRPATAFNTGNWDQPRPVTLTAREDADTADETVTITHRVESADADYEGITVPDLTVNVIDNDTPQVTGVWTQPGDRQLVVNWTATDKATGYKVQWKAPGDNYNTYGRLANITSGSTSSYTIPNLTNGTEYTVLVTATWTGHSDGPASRETTGTPTP